MEDFTKKFIIKKINAIDLGCNCVDMIELATQLINHIGDTMHTLDVYYSMDVVEWLKILNKDIKNLIKGEKNE